MTTTVKLRKLLHRKQWELIAPSPFGNTNNGHCVDSDSTGIVPGNDSTYYVAGASNIYKYNANEDSWIQLPNSGNAGTFGGGACIEASPLGMLGGSTTSTATAGTTTTITTTRTIVRGLPGCKVRVVGGTGIGYEGTIVSNTTGANAQLTVSPAASTAFNATTVIQVFSGSLWFMNSGVGTVGFSVYDAATNAWTAKSVTNLPTTWGNDAQLLSTPSTAGAFVTQTTTGGTTTTINGTFDSNRWANYQVRITAGTGIGQVRTITSNTTTALTVATAWTTVPDATSVFVIEGNDDYMYLLGNNAITLYRYSISANTWTVLAPTTARASASGAGSTADWINGVPDSSWNDGSFGTHYTGMFQQNGRYIYSFRAGGNACLDVYDIVANNWVNDIMYGNRNEVLNSGTSSTSDSGRIFLTMGNTGRFFRFDVASNKLEPLSTCFYPQSNIVVGCRTWIQTYQDGSTKVQWLYTLSTLLNQPLRMLII